MGNFLGFVSNLPGVNTISRGAIQTLDDVVPGSPGVTLKNNIANPNTNYQGQPNPSPLSAPANPAVQGASTLSSGSNDAYSTSSGGGGYSAAQSSDPAAASAFKGLYDTEIGNLQGQYNALPAYQQAAAGNIQMQYDPQYNTLQTQHTSGLANLDLAQNQLDTSRSQGLRNLGNSLRGALNGYQNQIGVMGAGNSSAAPLIGYALSQQGNRQTADMNTNYNQQQTGINQQHNDLEANFKNQLDGLNAWKESNLNQIAQQYAQSQAQLQQSILGAQGDEARYLAMYGQTALANQTIAQMQALENQYKDQVGQLNNHFQQVNAPIADVSKYAGPYQISQITPDQLSPLNFSANAVNSDAPTSTASLLKRPDQTPNTNPLGV